MVENTMVRLRLDKIDIYDDDDQPDFWRTNYNYLHNHKILIFLFFYPKMIFSKTKKQIMYIILLSGEWIWRTLPYKPKIKIKIFWKLKTLKVRLGQKRPNYFFTIILILIIFLKNPNLFLIVIIYSWKWRMILTKRTPN